MPLILIISMISFSIIRLNITIKSINITYIILLLCFFVLLYFTYKIKYSSILAAFSLVSLSAFSYYLSCLDLLPFDLIINNNFISRELNFIFISCFFLIYWLQSITNKSTFFLKITISVFLFILCTYVSNLYPINISTYPIILKTGDPLADLKLNPSISTETLKAEEKRLGLDKDLHIQYFLWLRGFLHGDLGITQQNQQVIKVIQRPIINSLLLSISTLLCTWLIAIPLGIWAALSQNKFIDRFLAFLTSCGMSTPTFVLAVLGLLFALNTQIVPIGGLTSINFYEMNPIEKFIDISKHLLLPTFILTLVSIAALQRQMRANLLDVLRQEYIKTAIAKGLPQDKIIYKHALKNAINPLITIFGFELASLLSGAALTETILAYPGIGALTLEAARKLDLNLTMATLIIGATMLIAGNLIADVMLKFADPRIKLGES